MKHRLAVIGLILGLFAAACESQDMMDKRQLRKHFNLTQNTELLEYKGYPAMVGFGQREGLNIQAVYRLSTSQVAEIVQNGQKTGWRRLPIPKKLLAKLPYKDPAETQIKMPFSLSEGLFLCKTVGDNVLYAPASAAHLCEDQAGQLHCTGPVTQAEAETSDKCKRRFSDQILGILDPKSAKLYVFIGSGY